jgi:predicted HicB family RNase H-like nuclease
MKEKNEKINLTVSISPKLHKKIKENGYNANSLVNQLIKKYLEKTQK